MNFTLAIGIMAGVGGAFSYVAWRAERISASAWFRWGGLAVWILVLALMRSQVDIRTRAGAFTTVLSIAAGSLFWGPFIAFFINQNRDCIFSTSY